MTAFQTLQSATLMMFALYGVAALIGIRVYGNPRPAVWFAGSNLLHAVALLFAVLHGEEPHWLGAARLLLVAGLVLLHRSFAEQLDRPRLLWNLQLFLLGLMIVAVPTCSHMQRGGVLETFLFSSVVGVQAALTASALFSFSGEGTETAGRFAGVAMVVYALVYLMRAVVTLRFGSPTYGVEMERASMVCIMGAMISGGATTFGFGFIASGKQRLELLWRAQIDELTGLLNRWAFKRVAVRETFRGMRKGTQMSVLTMDLDGMKRVNDRLGHSCGDAVLQAVAARLQEALRDRDSIARMGGDEFCILLPDTGLDEAVIVAERLRAEVEALDVRYRSETVKVRASFGVSSTEQIGWSWQRLVDESDAALYEAKRGGNVRVVSATPDPQVKQPIPLLAGEEAPAERRRRY